MIEGIRFVKLYGWELAFKNIISLIRKSELLSLKKLARGKSLEKTLGGVTNYTSSFLMLLIAYYSGVSLTTPLIFSCVEAMITLRVFTFELVTGISLYY